MLRVLIIAYLIVTNLLTGPTVHRITTYGPECGNITATGHRIDWQAVAEGRERTAAVSREGERLFPMNSVVWVEGRGFWVIRDRTAKWLDAKFGVPTIDLAQTEGFGREFRQVWLLWSPSCAQRLNDIFHKGR